MVAVKPKKKLGQHFLKDENIALKIVKAFLDHHSTGLAIEIGPGTGVLTKHLLAKESMEFAALDVDQESIDYLHKLYPDRQNELQLSDFLTSDILMDKADVGIIGNFPYNISSQIFFKVYESKDTVSLLVGMLQKEVAERICAKPKNKIYGILSVLMQAYYSVEYLFTVSPGVFDPPPKVQSAVIRLVRNDEKELSCDPKLFKRVVKAGFQQRRKTLRNALKSLKINQQLTQEEVFSKRAEQLSVDDFIQLTIRIANDGGTDPI